MGAFWEKHWLVGKSRKGSRYYKYILTVNYFILGLKIRKYARYYSRVLREKLTFGGKSRKCARYYKRVLREKLTFETLISRSTLIIGQNTNFLTKKSNGQKTNFFTKTVENVLDIEGAFERKIDWHFDNQQKQWLSWKITAGGKGGGRKRIRYYKRVLRGN